MTSHPLNSLFEIHIEELSSWDKREQKNNFFEIVYIEKGNGFQCINNHQFEYQTNNIFLLPPLDCHSFTIHEKTTFYFIRFTDHFFFQPNSLTDYHAWFDRITYILTNYNKIPGDIISSDRERQFIIQNIKAIYQEHLLSDSFSESIISGSIATILNILARSIEKNYVGEANKLDSRFGELLRHINTHLLDADQLRVPYLAQLFNISKSYFSEYFKKQANISLADYIQKAKLRIVETKVLHTDLTLKEIAYQLHFTDSSHLSRIFKKNYGVTVKEFKRTQKVACNYV